MRKLLSMLLCLFIGIGLATAQTTKVSGVVISAEDGEPVIGASIVAKGTTTGTVTNFDGKFELNVEKTVKFLTVSYVGMKTQEVAIRPNLRIVLESDAEELEEVMVVAYGTTKKASFTGSAQVVKADKIEKRLVSSVSKAIEGTVTGVQSTSGGGEPGSSSNLVIRGFGSINATNTPLYVVDGVPYGGSISAINPNDIESLTVLKDASAAALYGSRGANGVVMITTKKGSGSSDKTTVNLKASWGFASRALKRYDTVNESEFIQLAYEGYKNQAIYQDGMSAAAAAQVALERMASSSVGIFGVNEEYNPYNVPASELIDPTTGLFNPNAQLRYSEDWMDELTEENPLRQEYQFSVNGGSKNTKFIASLGYLKEEGLLITTDFERFSGRMNVDNNTTDWMKFGMNVNFAQTKYNYSSATGSQNSNVWYSAQQMAPIYPVYAQSPDGGPVLDENGNKVFDYGANRPIQNNWNPIGTLIDDKSATVRDNFSTREYVRFFLEGDKYGIFEGLELTANFGADYYNSQVMSYYNPYNGNAANVNGRLSKSTSRALTYTFNQLLNYNHQFGDHNVQFLLGHEYYALKVNNLSAQKTGFPLGGIYELAGASTITDASSSQDRYSLESVLTRLNYDYLGKYYLSGSWRTDGSSRFFKDSRWGNFWSMGASWRISQEKFMEDITWVDNLSLKGSYGVQGNDQVGGYYAWQSNYNLGWSNAALNGAVVSGLENKNLKWEKNKNLNIGIDARLFNRLSIVADFFQKKTSDMLLFKPMATSTGFDGAYTNIGNMWNRGFELSLAYDVFSTDNFGWTTTIMGSHVKNKITKLVDGEDIISGSYIYREGESIYSFYLPESAGIDPITGSKLYWENRDIKDGDGNVTGTERVKTSSTSNVNANRVIAGSRMPKIFGSWSNELRYRGFDLSIMTTYSVGGKILDGLYNGFMNPTTYKGITFHSNALRRWQNPGDQTDVAKIMWGDDQRTTSDMLVDASYFAIKNITLGYNLPKRWMNKIKFESVRVFGTADNLAVFSHLDGMDPQYNFSGGTDYTYTPSKTISFGIDIRF